MFKPTTLLLSLASSTLASPSNNSWSGWKTTKHLFLFGDSYTQTGFNPNATQPSPSNPFGNPAYPGWTSSNGPNWAGFLTTTHNQSEILAYNFASGGATVDSALVAPYAATVTSMKEQIGSEFLGRYGYTRPHDSRLDWDASSSLFAFFIGINDVGNSWWLNNATLYDTIFTQYAALLDILYDTGARNFLFLQVPPVNKSPLITSQPDDGYAIEYEGRVIADWNERLADMSARFKTRYPDITSFVHGTNALFEQVIRDPSSLEQTAGYRNTTAFCKAYANGTPSWYTKDPSCEYQVNEYLWLNDLHPTFPVHNATAASIADMLSK